MTHPLTDDIIESEISTPTHFVSNSLVGLFTHDDLRAAADWQLKQVIEWLDFELYCFDLDGVTEIDYDNLFKDLKKAMRPQQQENN